VAEEETPATAVATAAEGGQRSEGVKVQLDFFFFYFSVFCARVPCEWGIDGFSLFA
jgi:hypothetical protein